MAAGLLVVVNLVALVIPVARPAAASVWAILNENFDSVTAPALPAGWTATLATGQSTDRAWRTGAPSVTTYPNAAFASAPSHVTDNRLTTPAFVPLSTTTSLSFQHYVALQPGYDGGVLEIKIGTGSWVDFVSAGGRFIQDGYDRAISTFRSSPIGGRNAWTGLRTSDGSSPFTYNTRATLPASASGQSTQLRWRLATDNASGSGGYWRIDSIQVTSPVVTVTVNQAASQADPTSTSPINFTAVFSMSVTGFTAGDVTIGGTAPGSKSVTVTGGPATYNIAVSGMTASGSVSASIPAGAVNERNLASTSTDNVVAFAGPRTVTLNQAAGQPDPTNASPIRFEAVFSDAVTGFTGSDVFIGGTAPGTKSVAVTGGPTVYAIAVSGMTASGTVVPSIPANVVNERNAAATWTDNTVAYDTAPPGVAINQASGQVDPAKSMPVAFTAVFSEPVTGFTGSDVSIGGTAPGTKTVAVTGGPMTYAVTVSGMTGSGSVVATIPAGRAFDRAGNPSTASTATDNVVTYTAAPSVTINQATTQADPTNTSTIGFTVNFSAPVTGFTSADVAIGGTAPGAKTVVISGGPTTYAVAVSGLTGSGTVVASIPANSVSGGNLASTSSDNSVTYDNLAPGVTINQAATQVDPSTTSPITFTAVFGEPVSGFEFSDVAFAGTAPGTKTGTITGGPTTYTVTVSGMTGSGTVVASIPAGRVTDAVGNPNVASTSTDNSVQVNLRTVTINQAAAQADPTKASPITFTVAFSAAVTGFTSSDVAISSTTPGTLTTAVTGGPSTYTVTISGMTGSGLVAPFIRANVVDGGNAASSSTDNRVAYDITAPTVTINQAATQVDPSATSPIRFTAVFSEPVTGFTGSDVSIGGTATGIKTATVTGGPTTFTVAVSGMNRSGTVVASIAAGRVTDTAGNLNVASTSTDNSVQVNLRTVTIDRAVDQPDPTNAMPIRFTVVFSTAVTGFTSSDVTTGGTVPGQTAVVTGGPTIFSVAITGMTTSGTVIPSIRANVVDGGNVASTSTDNLVIVDTVPPTVAIDQSTRQLDPTTVAPVKFVALFNSTVTGFSEADVSITGTAPGTMTAVVSGANGTYFIDVYGMTGPGTVVVSVPAGAAFDTAGNPSTASTSTDNIVQYGGPSAVLLDVGGNGVDGTGVATTALLTGTNVTSRWTVAGTDDAFVVADATGLRAIGFDVRTADGVPVDGLFVVRGGLVLTKPSAITTSPVSGWALLGALDVNADGTLDALDATFNHLRLFSDANGDGSMVPSEVASLDAVKAIRLTAGTEYLDSYGSVRRDGSWVATNSTTRLAVEIRFASA